MLISFFFCFTAGALGTSGVGAQSIVSSESSRGVGSGSSSSSSSSCGTSVSGVSGGGSGGGTSLMTSMAPVPPMMPPTQQPPPLAAPQAATPELPMFVCPRRPNLGREGRPIMLRANHFQISMPRGFIHHYDISIQPDKCPRKVNR